MAYLEGLEAEERLNTMVQMKKFLDKLEAEEPKDLRRKVTGVQSGH